MDFLRARREPRYQLVVNDPRPVESLDTMWATAAQVAVIGIFALMLGAVLYFGRAILMPVVAAVVIGTTLSPLVKRASRYGISPPVTALLVVVVIVGIIGLGATLVAGPVGEWIGRAPEIGATVKQKLFVLDRPLAALHDLQQTLMPSDSNTVTVATAPSAVFAPVLAVVTPAAAQLLLFFGTLIFYLVGHKDLRERLVFLFGKRDSQLRFLKITNDIEHNLTGYVTIVTVINVVVGLIVGIGAWLFGYPNPVIFGILATVLNYLPYIGPAAMALILFGVGLVTFPLLGTALAATLGFVALATLEGHLITPTVIGRRMTLNPLMVFLALAFWAWLWGPIGAFLALPISIITLVTIHHLFPTDETKLPG